MRRYINGVASASASHWNSTCEIVTHAYTTAMSDIKPFDPTIPQEEVDRLFRKLKDTRLPETPVVPDAGDDYGGFVCE
jgi:hypothetical protein